VSYAGSSVYVDGNDEESWKLKIACSSSNDDDGNGDDGEDGRSS